MGLTEYKKKRNFRKSPEPTGGKPESGKLRFVIQKHHASRLHYDFRLELNGVLLSWAVPKGPSTDPSVKRLAMMVEDHPYDYKDFEGIIPGGYGAGTVMVWDEGTYEAAEVEAKDKKEMEKELKKQLHAGKLKFYLHGKKLKGEYALVKASGRGENSWLLMKMKDKYASEKEILDKDKSAVSGRSLEQITEEADNFWDSSRPAAEKPESKKKSVRKKSRVKSKQTRQKDGKAKKEIVAEGNLEKILKKGKTSKFPRGLTPMLATLTDGPFDSDEWIFEIKWDGYRALAFMHSGKVEMRSRNNKSFDDKFYPVHDALTEWSINAVVDGEVAVLVEKGMSSFGALQNWRSEADGHLVFYVFDLLWYEGKDLRGLPLIERKQILKSLVPESDTIRFSENFNGSGTEFFEVAREAGLEGIIAKKAMSTYHAGLRTRDWLKIKTGKRQEVVIGGYTVNEDTHKHFSALLAGVYENGKLVYVGKIGTGFNMKDQAEMMKLFKPLITDKIPFSYEPDVNKASRFRPNPPRATVTWLKPKLVCEVNYTEITSDGIMRHPSFQGMRTDKKPKDIILEKEIPVEKALNKKKVLTEKKMMKPTKNTGRKTLLNPKDETQVRKINGHEVKFTNLSKLYWPEDKVSKRDMLNYYYKVAPFILPYLKDRPQSLNRHPNGIHGHSFYQKDVTGKVPDWIKKFLYHSEADERDKHFMVCTNDASLLYMASLGCIELNPWHSRIQNPDHPDWCIIDLDPGETTFEQVIEAAQVTKSVLDRMDVPAYPKTSGSKGIHIYIPLGAKYTYEQSKEFARIIVSLVHEEIPEFTSLERVVKNRKGKMYLDFLQNRAQATIAAPYSLRPKRGAPVSMPLHWHEVKSGLKITDFNIFNAMDRLKKEGDLFKPVLGKGIKLESVLKELQEMSEMV